jgi:NH3-dependent NAD+ synthetase
MADSFNLGRHEEAIENLSRDMADVKSDVRAIRESLAEKKGERRAALYVSGGVGSVVATLITFAAKHFKVIS